MKSVFAAIIFLILTFNNYAVSYKIIKKTAKEIVIKLEAGEYELKKNGNYYRIEGKDFDFATEEGAPQIPLTSFKIGVPPGGNANCVIIPESVKTFKLDSPLVPVPEIRDEGIDSYVYKIDGEKYLKPFRADNSGKPFKFRSINLKNITIPLFKYDYSSSNLTAFESQTIKINISGDTRKNETLTDELVMKLKDNILNFEYAVNWADREEEEVNYLHFSDFSEWYAFKVSEDGIYKITYDDLHDLPLNDIDPNDIRIFSSGGASIPENEVQGLPVKEISIGIEGDEDHSFDANDYIWFYAEDRDGYEKNDYIDDNLFYNPYGGETVYWITWGAEYETEPKRITELNLSDYDARQDWLWANVYSNNDLIKYKENGFYWFSQIFNGDVTKTHTFNFNLTNPVPGTKVKYKFGIKSQFTSDPVPPHRIKIYFDDDMAGTPQEYVWYGKNLKIFSDSLNMVNGNTAKFFMDIYRTSEDNLGLDFFDLKYQQKLEILADQSIFYPEYSENGETVRFDIVSADDDFKVLQIDGFSEIKQLKIRKSGSDFFTVANIGQGTKIAFSDNNNFKRITGVLKAETVDIAEIASGYGDGIIIYPSEFRSAAESLSDVYKDEYGFDITLADQADIMNQFNGGNYDPAAIRSFLYHAYSHPDSDIKFVTLLGSGTQDWRNKSGIEHDKNKIMIYQKGSRASEDYFVAFNTTYLPEIPVGRYPAQNIDEAEFLINRTKSYLVSQKTGWWKNKAVFTCDDHTKPSLSFFEEAHINSLLANANVVNKSIILKKLMGNEYRMDEFNQKRDMTDDIIKAVNKGVLVWYYNGHGSWKCLGDESYFKLDDIKRLDNLQHLPLFVAASCNVSKYDIESYSCMGEEILFGETGGAVASVGALRPTNSSTNRGLMSRFFVHVLNERNYLGTALLLAKLEMHHTGNASYSVLGDPVLDIMPPITSKSLEYGTEEPVNAMETVSLDIRYEDAVSGISRVLAYDSPQKVIFSDTNGSDSVYFEYFKYGNPIFKGNVTAENGISKHKFVVPLDINNRGKGRVLSYIEDKINQKSYVSYNDEIRFEGVNASAENNDLPAINIFLNSDNFKDGDAVSNNPLLIADIGDANGINISGLSGHQIFVQIDDGSPLSATSSFEYNLDSWTEGRLNYRMPTMEKGFHTMKIIAFDSQNKAGIDSTRFVITNSGITDSSALYLTDVLPYPNPYSYDGKLSFTFNLSERADVSVSVYTVTGRKIQKITKKCGKGFNYIKWDGRDKDGDKLSNNSYIYRIKAVRTDNGRSAEKKAVFTVYK